MTADTIHTCSYECERPGCIRAQRDELVSRLEALTAAQQQPATPPTRRVVEFDGTDREVLREFIRVCREHKPVGPWPGERICSAIERAMDNERPFRFIAEADMAPEREPSMKDSDRMLSGPRRRRVPPPAAAQQDGGEVEGLAKLLERIRDLLASLPVDCLGSGTGVNGQPYPIRDEVIHGITVALAQQGGGVT